MKKKKVFIIILSTILTLLLIMIFYILFFKNKNIENQNNKVENPIDNKVENLVLELENNGYKYTEEEKNAGLNKQVEGIKYCYYEEDCFKEIFLNCQPGNYIHFTDETSPYNFMIMSEYENNCLLLIQDLKNTDSKNINCKIPVSEISEALLNNFLILDQTTLDKYCN